MANSAVLISALTLTVLLGYVQVSGAVQCYACSYIFSGNTGIFDYECVNNTANFTKKSVIPCTAPRKCTIKTVYTQDYGFIHSLTKGCQVPEKKTSCDKYEEVRPTCYYNCETDLCNSKDGDLKPPRPSSKTSAVKSTSSLIFGLILLMFLKGIYM